MARFLRADASSRPRPDAISRSGPGHGFLFLSAIEVCSFDEFLGVDLSAASVEQTRTIVDHFHPDAPPGWSCGTSWRRTTLRRDRSMRSSWARCSSTSSSRRCSFVGSPSWPRTTRFIFVTTCINAPAIDHIYLWRTTDEFEEMIEASGLSIVEALRLPYEGKSLEESREECLPINVAYVLAKAVDACDRRASCVSPISSMTSPPRRWTKATVESKVTAWVGGTSSIASFSISLASDASRSSTQKHRWSRPPPRVRRAEIGDSRPGQWRDQLEVHALGHPDQCAGDSQQRVVRGPDKSSPPASTKRRIPPAMWAPRTRRGAVVGRAEPSTLADTVSNRRTRNGWRCSTPTRR